MENMVVIASQMTDESIEALEIDVAHIYLQIVGVDPKKWRYNTFSHYNTLFEERLREELQEIQENLHKKNEEIQQKNEEI